MQKPLNVDLTFADEDPDMVMGAMTESGAANVKKLSERGFTGIEIVYVAVLAVSALANLVIRLAPLWKCGIVVDARGARVSTTKNCDLPRGTVLVISKNGTESKLHEPSEIQLKDLLEQMG